MRLLLVEDDRLIGDGIRAALTQEGYAVDWLKDGSEAETTLRFAEHELLILDLGLPSHSGMEILKKLRAKGNNIPVLVLTARDSVRDRISGLDSGADDYLVKPFDLSELSARLRALVRRKGGRSEPLITLGAVSLDPASRRVTCQGKEIDLSSREYSILHTLLENRGKVLSKFRIEESLYGWNEEIESNAVEVHVHHLRKKLGSAFIRTVRGVGYIVDVNH